MNIFKINHSTDLGEIVAYFSVIAESAIDATKNYVKTAKSYDIDLKLGDVIRVYFPSEVVVDSNWKFVSKYDELPSMKFTIGLCLTETKPTLFLLFEPESWVKLDDSKISSEDLIVEEL
jgi:hypothetical protein